MPSFTASFGPAMRTSWPSNEIVPTSCWWIPAMVFTSVDLPAPLSPTRATTSAGWTRKSTPSSAWTGPKLLLTPSRERTGWIELMTCTLFSACWPGGRPVSRPPCAPLLNARRLARARVLRRADLLLGPEPVLDDRVVDVVLGHRHRGED